MTFDHFGRDVAEYVKDLIINNKFSLEDFSKYLEFNNATKCDVELIYARILFPSFLYDYLENCISDGEIINVRYLQLMTESYEHWLEKITKFLHEKYSIIPIEWLKKDNA